MESVKQKVRGLMNTKEAAAYLGLSSATLRFWRVRKHRSGPAYYKLHKGAVRYSCEDLEGWLRDLRVEGEAK